MYHVDTRVSDGALCKLGDQSSGLPMELLAGIQLTRAKLHAILQGTASGVAALPIAALLLVDVKIFSD